MEYLPLGNLTCQDYITNEETLKVLCQGLNALEYLSPMHTAPPSTDIDLVDPFLSVGKFTALKFLSIDDLANALADELIGFQIGICSETTTFLICLKYCYARVLLPLKSSILAVISTIGVVDTLHLGRTVDTRRVFPACSVDFCTVISSRNSVYLWCANSKEYG